MTKEQQDAINAARLVLKAAGLTPAALLPRVGPPAPDDLLTPQAACAAAGVSRTTLYVWFEQGLPSIGRGDRRRVRRDVLLAHAARWCEAGAAKPMPQDAKPGVRT